MKRYDAAISALDNMNALLDEEHRITIDTDLYNETLAAEKFFVCGSCTETKTQIVDEGTDEEHKEKIVVPSEIPYSKVHVFEMVNGFYDSVVTKQKKSKVWVCPKCQYVNKLSCTEIIKPVREDPYYIGVIPERPRRVGGNRLGFVEKINWYFQNYTKELEYALMNYRIAYIREHGEDMVEGQFKDKGD